MTPASLSSSRPSCQPPPSVRKVYRSEDLGTTWVIQGGAISYTTLRETFTGLTAKTIYSWKLRAWNARGFTDSEVAYFKAVVGGSAGIAPGVSLNETGLNIFYPSPRIWQSSAPTRIDIRRHSAESSRS